MEEYQENQMNNPTTEGQRGPKDWVKPHVDKIYKTIEEMFAENDLGTYVEAVTDGIYSELCENVGANSDRHYDKKTRYDITEDSMDKVYTGLRLITHLTRIYGAHKAIEYMQKEVSHE